MTNDLRLEDRAVITEQMHRFARALDWLELDDLRHVLATDVVMASPHSGDLTGIDAVLAWMHQEYSPFETTHHLISNISVTFTGAGSAEAVSYVSAWHRHVEGEHPDVLFWGEYHDTWTLVEGAWRIAIRRTHEAGVEPRRFGGTPNRRRARR